MSSTAQNFQITQQLRVFAGRMTRAERDQQAAIATLQIARRDKEAAADTVAQFTAQLAEANAQFAASAASEQARIWRDTTKQRQADAQDHLEQCKLSEGAAADDLHAANRALQKLQLQNDQILARKTALSKTKLKRQEAGIEDDRNTGFARGPANVLVGM